jgi:hypothetical protein
VSETQEIPTTLRKHRHRVQKQASKGIHVLSGVQGLSQEAQVAKLTEAQRFFMAAQAQLQLAITFAESRDFSAVLAAKQAKKATDLAEFQETIGAASLDDDGPFQNATVVEDSDNKDDIF